MLPLLLWLLLQLVLLEFFKRLIQIMLMLLLLQMLPLLLWLLLQLLQEWILVMLLLLLLQLMPLLLLLLHLQSNR